MPTPEEIKKITNKIARSFVHPDDHTPYGEQTYRQVEAVITQLSKGYCIVPKSKINALHEEIHGEIMCANDDDDWQSVAHYILDVMPRTFSDVFGKSLFEE